MFQHNFFRQLFQPPSVTAVGFEIIGLGVGVGSGAVDVGCGVGMGEEFKDL